MEAAGSSPWCTGCFFLTDRVITHHELLLISPLQCGFCLVFLPSPGRRGSLPFHEFAFTGSFFFLKVGRKIFAQRELFDSGFSQIVSVFPSWSVAVKIINSATVSTPYIIAGLTAILSIFPFLLAAFFCYKLPLKLISTHTTLSALSSSALLFTAHCFGWLSPSISAHLHYLYSMSTHLSTSSFLAWAAAYWSLVCFLISHLKKSVNVTFNCDPLQSTIEQTTVLSLYQHMQ